MRTEMQNLDGRGPRRVRVFDLAGGPADNPYWGAVTDVSCPCCASGTIRWAEGGYVPGYRICDDCGRHFLAGGNASAPTLTQMPERRKGPVYGMVRKARRHAI